ncbi:MAG TPA: DinB family protein [Blastocatellia bacterium]|nr:DinB family protein [Blastocatellia bacterium]
MQYSDATINPSTEILIAENIKVLREAQKLLECMDDRTYTKVDAPTFTSSLGAQLRHCLDFYQCFLTGVKNGKVDYDLRERDEVTEHSRTRAIERIVMTTELLWKLSLLEEPTTLWVKQDSPYWSTSSLRRELQFLLSHLVHHQALVAVMLRLQGFVPNEDIGVAPATLAYRKERHPFNVLRQRQPRLSLVL